MRLWREDEQKMIPLFMKKLGNLEKVSSRFFRREPRKALVCYGNSVAAMEGEAEPRDCQERRVSTVGTVHQSDHSRYSYIYQPYSPSTSSSYLHSAVSSHLQTSNLVDAGRRSIGMCFLFPATSKVGLDVEVNQRLLCPAHNLLSIAISFPCESSYHLSMGNSYSTVTGIFASVTSGKKFHASFSCYET